MENLTHRAMYCWSNVRVLHGLILNCVTVTSHEMKAYVSTWKTWHTMQCTVGAMCGYCMDWFWSVRVIVNSHEIKAYVNTRWTLHTMQCRMETCIHAVCWYCMDWFCSVCHSKQPWNQGLCEHTANFTHCAIVSTVGGFVQYSCRVVKPVCVDYFDLWQWSQLREWFLPTLQCCGQLH